MNVGAARRRRVQARDAVVEEQAARSQQRVHRLHVGIELGPPDVLVHADARDLVEWRLVDLAVVEHAHLGAVGQAGCLDPPARELRLRLRERHAERAHAVAGRGVQDERAPATADVEQALTRLQAQLAADQLELALLRALERVAGVREVGAGVDEARPEQQLVEAVRDVVVMADRGPVAAHRVQPPGGCGLGGRDGRSPQRAGTGDAQGRGRESRTRRAARARGRRSAGAGRARAPDRRRHPARPRPMPGRARAGWARAGSARSPARRVSARQAHRGRRARRPCCRPRSAPSPAVA